MRARGLGNSVRVHARHAARSTCAPHATLLASGTLSTFMRMRLATSLLRAACVLALATPSVMRAQAAPSSASGAAGEAARQLAVGEQWFRAACLECHAGGTLANADFRLKWSGRSAQDLLGHIRTTMPQNNPGSLTPGTYAAISAYLLKLNGMAVTTRLVASDSASLTRLRLTFPASPGSTP